MEQRKLLRSLSFTFVTVLSIEAGATSTPTFTSGPAVVQVSSASAFPSTSTVIFAYRDGIPQIISRVSDNSPTGFSWYQTDGHHHTIAGGYDGDPAAVYIPSAESNFLTCGHAATGPGYMYCARLLKFDKDHFPTTGSNDGPYAVGSGTFSPGTSPVLAVGSLYIYMFARGMDNQIWYAKYTISSNSWSGWSPISPSPTDGFDGDPGAISISSTSDTMLVAAHLHSNSAVAYTKGDGSGWDNWVTVSDQPPTAFKPALARGSSSILLFGIRNDVSPNFDLRFTTSPTGGNAGNWGSYSGRVGDGYGLTSGPSALANRANATSAAMAIARGGDNALWFIVAGPDPVSGALLWTGWTQLQISN